MVSGKYVYAGKKRCAKYQKFILIPDNASWYTAIRSESLIKASYKIVKRLFGLNYILQKYHRSVSNVGLLFAYNLCMQIVKKLGREKMFAMVGYNASSNEFLLVYKDFMYIEGMPEDKNNIPFYQKHGFSLMENGVAIQICNYDNVH